MAWLNEPIYDPVTGELIIEPFEVFDDLGDDEDVSHEKATPMINLPVLYDPDFAAWQQPMIIFTPPHDARWANLRDEIAPPRRGNDMWDQIVDPLMGRPMYFDRQGTPISMRRWGELRERGIDADGRYGPNSYVRVGEDRVGEVTVSTVWLGIDHGFNFDDPDNYRPVIFETMIFGGEHDDAMMRYCTDEEAVKGHAEAVEDLRMGMRPWWSHGGVDDDEWRMQP